MTYPKDHKWCGCPDCGDCKCDFCCQFIAEDVLDELVKIAQELGLYD